MIDECEFHGMNIDEIEPNDWKMEIVEYLRNLNSKPNKKDIEPFSMLYLVMNYTNICMMVF